MEYGNYMMIVSENSEGVLNRTYKDIKSAFEHGCLVTLKTELPGASFLFYLGAIDESQENAYTVAFGTLGPEHSFTSETIDGYPVRE